MNEQVPANFESDPRFPSGPWTGFYLQYWRPGRHKTEVDLFWKDGIVTGDGYDRVDDWSEIEQLEGLPGGLAEREQNIVRAHYGLDGEQQTLREIAGGMGLSVERVRQLEERALDKLRAVVAG